MVKFLWQEYNKKAIKKYEIKKLIYKLNFLKNNYDNYKNKKLSNIILHLLIKLLIHLIIFINK